MTHQFSYPLAHRIFPDQGLNPCPLHWQVDSLPLAHHGSPGSFFKKLNIPLYFLSMAPLGIYPNNWKLVSIQNLHTDVYTNFIHNCRNLEANWCASVGKKINKSQYSQTKEYFLVLKRKELSSHKDIGGAKNGYYKMREVNLKKVCMEKATVWFQFYYILEKAWKEWTTDTCNNIYESWQLYAKWKYQTKATYCIILIIKGKQGTFGSEGNTLHLDCDGSYTILYVCQTALLHILQGNFIVYKIYSLCFIYLNF